MLDPLRRHLLAAVLLWSTVGLADDLPLWAWEKLIDQPVTLEIADGSEMTGTLIAVDAKQAVLVKASGDVMAVDRADVRALRRGAHAAGAPSATSVPTGGQGTDQRLATRRAHRPERLDTFCQGLEDVPAALGPNPTGTDVVRWVAARHGAAQWCQAVALRVDSIFEHQAKAGVTRLQTLEIYASPGVWMKCAHLEGYPCTSVSGEDVGLGWEIGGIAKPQGANLWIKFPSKDAGYQQSRNAAADSHAPVMGAFQLSSQPVRSTRMEGRDVWAVSYLKTYDQGGFYHRYEGTTYVDAATAQPLSFDGHSDYKSPAYAIGTTQLPAIASTTTQRGLVELIETDDDGFRVVEYALLSQKNKESPSWSREDVTIRWNFTADPHSAQPFLSNYLASHCNIDAPPVAELQRLARAAEDMTGDGDYASMLDAWKPVAMQAAAAKGHMTCKPL